MSFTVKNWHCKKASTCSGGQVLALIGSPSMLWRTETTGHWLAVYTGKHRHCLALYATTDKAMADMVDRHWQALQVMRDQDWRNRPLHIKTGSNRLSLAVQDWNWKAVADMNCRLPPGCDREGKGVVDLTLVSSSSEGKKHDCCPLRADPAQTSNLGIKRLVIVRYHSGGSMKLNARILFLAHMVYL
jgi:hypothetical protein